MLKLRIILALLVLFFISLAADAANYPFPQKNKYRYGIMPTISREVMVSDTQTAFSNWVARYVTTQGCPSSDALRVHRAGAFDYDTVSEGIGWGMLITVLMDNDLNQTQKYFDGFWNYYKHYENQHGLMAWKITREGTIESTESATEADENAAMALLYAHKQWGSGGKTNYLLEARTLIGRIMLSEVITNNNAYILKPGADWGGTEIINPGYFAPSYYRAWKIFDERWLKVADRAYKIYGIFNARYETGLFPDWCVPDGSTSYLGYNFSYDACQVPLKIGFDFLWNGQGENSLEKITDWFAKKSNGSPGAILDGYKLNGQTIGKYNNAAFIGPLAVAAMNDLKYQYWLDLMYLHLVNMPTGGRWGYYPDTIRLMSLIVLSGNLPNLWEGQDIFQNWTKG